ncbi:hypothetical protein [Draconibacterium halophilum]|uniref:NIPSNAP protein n=1 Tax=Draconibacterium halophilum TaxID=2706887 RepID=A0A6C0RDY4_9BACT|nr:hypothetical protein [Draconibacterium halophilum]QIA08146.1 hypothetical protein G0Q07_10640 [Draconibacterium halophilum]
MKKSIFLVVILLVSTVTLFAQEEDQPLYILLEFMSVSDEMNDNYWEVEEFWSKIHQQRIADNNILGWDLWAMNPAGTEQGSQYFTVTLFSSMAAMFEGIPGDKFEGYLQSAYPDLSEDERNEMMTKTVKSRDMAHQVFCKEINTTSGDFNMELGTVVVMDIMKQEHDSYEKVENEIFKPWHQQLVDNGQKGAWGLLRVILPAGSEAAGSHITYSMYKDYSQLANHWESNGGEMDMTTSLAVQKGLKTRDMRGVEMARLVMQIR